LSNTGSKLTDQCNISFYHQFWASIFPQIHDSHTAGDTSNIIALSDFESYLHKDTEKCQIVWDFPEFQKAIGSAYTIQGKKDQLITEIEVFSNGMMSWTIFNPDFRMLFDRSNKVGNKVQKDPIISDKIYWVKNTEDIKPIFSGLQMVYSGFYNLDLIKFILGQFKALEKIKRQTKKTTLYLVRLRFFEDKLELIPEYRNENYSNWGIFLAKRTLV
jgi:hypothetical protein